MICRHGAKLVVTIIVAIGAVGGGTIVADLVSVDDKSGDVIVVSKTIVEYSGSGP